MPSEKELNECINIIDAGMKYLLGNPLVPNDDGAIVQMNKHLKELNGTVEDILKEQEIAKRDREKLKYNQDNLLSRIWLSMPAWMQICVLVLLAGTVASISTAIKLWS